jgi:surface antigen
MSQHRGNDEDLLRRALHAAADSVEPSDDGLERIRARLRAPHPRPVAWMLAAYSEMPHRALGALHSGWVWLRTVLGTAHERWRARPGTLHRQAHLAPAGVATAIITAALLVVMTASALTLRQTFVHAGVPIRGAEGSGPSGAGGPGLNGNGSQFSSGGQAVTGTTPSTPSRSTRPSSPPTPIASASPSSLASPSPTASPSSPPSASWPTGPSSPGALSSPANPSSPASISPSSSTGPEQSVSGNVTWAGAAGPAAASQYFGYPYPNAPQCTTGPQVCAPDKWGFYQGQSTSWVAYRLNELNGVAFISIYGSQQWSDASYWATAAGNLNIEVSQAPALGSVAWWPDSPAHPGGLVGYVEEVNSPTSIIISEMNWDGGNGFRLVTVTKSGSDWPTDFLHIADR